MEKNEKFFKVGTAIKKPFQVNVYGFRGTKNIKTTEGIAYDVVGKDFYVLENPKTKDRWPIKKTVFKATYHTYNVDFTIEKGND